MTVADPQAGARLPRHVRNRIESELFRFWPMVTDVIDREQAHLSVRATDDDADLGVRRSAIAFSDTTGNAASRRLDDRTLQDERRWITAICAAVLRLPAKYAPLIRLYYFQRVPTERLLAQAGVSRATLWRVRTAVLQDVAADPRLAPYWGTDESS